MRARPREGQRERERDQSIPRVGGHHASESGVCAHEIRDAVGVLELEAKHLLEHGEQEMLLVLVVLVAVEREHDGLEEIVDLAQLDQGRQTRHVSRVGL